MKNARRCLGLAIKEYHKTSIRVKSRFNLDRFSHRSLLVALKLYFQNLILIISLKSSRTATPSRYLRWTKAVSLKSQSFEGRDESAR